MPNQPAATTRDSDAVIIGDGVIGLSTALELGRAGATVHVVGVRRDGAASGAAAGLLAPSIGRLEPALRAVFESSLQRFPAFIERLQAYEPELQLLQGLLHVTSAVTQDTASTVPIGAPLDAAGVASIEPSVVAARGVLHPLDAAIDNVRLMSALRLAVADQPGVRLSLDDPATSVAFSGGRGVVTTHGGSRVPGRLVVLAAGAWSSAIEGLPRPLPVVPLKGQMLAFAATCLIHPVAGDDIYLVPRGSEIVAGATVEHAGFDLSIRPAAIDGLRRAAVALCPPLANAPIARQWAGIRPATPDMLPILGPDPDQPRLIYACGHSKNGILLAPETAVMISRIVRGLPTERDFTQFSVSRFAR
jgi:glycine oxidase